MVPEFSIIIATKEIDAETKKCIECCLSQTFKNFEILLMPDFGKAKIEKTTIIETGKVKPSVKRNIAVKKAKGKFLAFVDSDAYPEKNWLNNCIKYFHDSRIGAVGGPNLTPKEDSFMQKAGGDVLASPLTGESSVRYKIAEKRVVDELPSCNLIVRREIFSKIQFEQSVLTAEDTSLCFEINKLGKKVLYVPDVIVFHHRRKLFYPHLKQMWIYGRDLAWLLKKKTYPSIVFLYHSLLSWFVLFVLLGGILSFFNPLIKQIYLLLITIYLFIVLIFSIIGNLKRAIAIFPGIILTHISYGAGFIYGLISRNPTLKEKA